MRRGSTITLGALKLTVLALASVSLILLLSGQLVAGAIVWSVGYAGWLLDRFGPGVHSAQSLRLLTRALFLIGAAGPLIHLGYTHATLFWVAVLAALLILPAAHALTANRPQVLARMAGIEARPPSTVLPRLRWTATLIGVTVPPFLLLSAGLQLNGIFGVLLVALQAVALSCAWALTVIEVRRDRHAYAQLPEMLARVNPQFLLHWDAPGASKYQLDMWLPHLEDLDIPFAVIVRNAGGFTSAVQAAENAPVIYAGRHADVERLLVPTVRAIFYVNNADRNNQVLRFEGIRHIMLSHGDSQKSTSSTRIFRLFDRIYMAGQAGIDRFTASGVEVPASRFSIVGRPQVRGIEQETAPIREKQQPTVLYAPTWMGDFKDASYTSLPHALPLIERLLERECTIIFRPHPFTDRAVETASAASRIKRLLREDSERTGRQHVFGALAESEMSLRDCFNHSDAMIADISAVVSDYLYSGKPLAVFSDDAAIGGVESEGKYRFLRDPSTWPEQLNRFLRDDPLRERRLEARRYYLGNAETVPPDQLFLDTARADIVAGHGQRA